MLLKRFLNVGLLIPGLILPHLSSAQTTALPKSEPSTSQPPSTDTKTSQKKPEETKGTQKAKAPESKALESKAPESKASENKEEEKKSNQGAKPQVQREPLEKLFFVATPTIDTSKDGLVVIDSTKAPGSYRSLRIKNVGDTEIDLTHVQIVYSDGSVHNEDRLINIRNGERTRKIAETSNDKFIDRIALSWKGTGGQTKIQVIGYQSSGGRKMQRLTAPITHNIPLPPTTQAPQETAQVGAKSPQSQPQEASPSDSEISTTPLVILPEKHVFFAAPRIDLSRDGTISIDIRRAQGAFRSVRVRNEGGNVVDLTQVQIVYNDGTVHNEDRLISIKKGERTKKIAETLTDKFIDKITLFWKPTGGQTKIQIIGYQTLEGRKMERPSTPPTQNIPLPPANQTSQQTSQNVSKEPFPASQDSNIPSPELDNAPYSALPEKPVFLASPKVDLSIDGNITIDTERTEGAFRSLRVRNKGGSLVNLTNVQILYSDGTIHNEERLINIKKGERTKKIAETPTDKFIDRITLSWNATGGQTKLQIIGYQTDEGQKMERSAPVLSQNIPLPPPPSATPPQIGPTLPPPSPIGPAQEFAQKNDNQTSVAPSEPSNPSASSDQYAKVIENTLTTPQTPTGTTQPTTQESSTSQEQDKINGTPFIPPAPLSPPTDTKDLSYAGEEILLGYQNISLSIERHNIKINPELGKLAHIRFNAVASELQMTTLKVLYSDGSFQDVTLNADLKDQAPSPWIELHGDKFLREIEYNIQTKKNSKEVARIEILGQHVKGWIVGNGEGKKFNQGWVLLGAKTTSFKNIDKDTFKIAENDGGLTKLKVIAKDRPLTLREIRVIYFSGPDEVFTIKDRVDPQKPYGPLEFRGGRSAVKEIQVKYRARIDLANGLNNLVEGAPAIVEIWGQY